jgi:regulator of ribonuclease activity A
VTKLTITKHNTIEATMSYQLPLTERIRIQFEILCENCADCFASLSGSYKKPMFFLASCMVFLTLRSAKRSINRVKMGGGLSGYSSSPYTSGYGTSSYGASTSSLTGGYGGYGSASTGGGLIGSGTTASYGVRGASPVMSPGYGGSTYGTNTMGASTFGSALGGGGKGTANLVDANPSGVIPVDPSIKFHNFGGTTDFYGQIEVVQAFDAAPFVSQILSQPGQSKVLVVDGGGSLNSALFDSEMASSASRNGWKGVVVYGAVRNAGQLSKTQFGVKALGTNPSKGRGMNGQRGAGVSIGSTQLQSGLWLYADQDGIVISQTDVSGGSFGSSSFGSSTGFGSTSSLTGGYGQSPSTLGGYGGASGTNLGYGTGGYSSSSSLSGGYQSGTNSMGYGTTTGGLTGGYSSGSSSLGGASSGYGASSVGLTGGYGSSSTSMYGGSSTYGSSSPYSYGRSTYSYSKRKKHKMFKILLATSIAAIVWITCLR